MQQLEKVEHELQLLAEDAGSAEADVPVWDLAAELNSAPPPRPEHDEGVDLDAEIEQFRGRTSGRWQKRADTSSASADLADPLSEYAAPPTPSFSTRSTFGSTPTGRLDLSSIDARSEFSRPPTTPTHNVSSRAVDAASPSVPLGLNRVQAACTDLEASVAQYEARSGRVYDITPSTPSATTPRGAAVTSTAAPTYGACNEKVFKLMARLVRHLDRSDAEVSESAAKRDKILAELDACKAQLKSQAASAREAQEKLTYELRDVKLAHSEQIAVLTKRVATLEEAKRLADDAALDAARVPQCFRPLNDPINEPLAAAASLAAAGSKKPAAASNPSRFGVSPLTDEAPRRPLAPDTMFAPSAAAEDVTPVRLELEVDKLVDSHWGARFSADFQSPSERVPLATAHVVAPPEAEEAPPTNFSTADELQHAAGFKLVGTIDDVASDGDPRDDAEVAAMKAAAAARVGAGGPPRVHGRYSEEPRTPVEQAPAPWAKAAADEEAAREGISREDVVSEGPWTGANSTPRLGGYTSARVTPDVMASDAETNAERSNVILQKYYDELSRTRSSKPVAKVRGRAGTPEGGPAAYPLRDAFAAVA